MMAAGEFRGGCGIQRRVRFDSEGWLKIVAERGTVPPYGLFGGGEAAPSQVVLTGADGDAKQLPSKTAPLNVKAGDELFLKCAAGDGFGDLRDRPVGNPQDDVDNAYVSPEITREVYGAEVVSVADRPNGVRFVQRNN
ncbi:hydantoinase B/oxoprolinase family protein [Micrococcaceae bacterium Sec5.1]